MGLGRAPALPEDKSLVTRTHVRGLTSPKGIHNLPLASGNLYTYGIYSHIYIATHIHIKIKSILRKT